MVLLRSRSLIKKYVCFITPIIAITIGIISVFIYVYTKGQLINSLRIEMLLQAEKASANMNQLLVKERALAQSLAKSVEKIQIDTYVAKDYEDLLIRFVDIYPETAGMGIWFSEKTFPEVKKAAPYAFRDGTNIVASDEIYQK